MSIRTVKYTGSNPILPCERCLPATVVIATYPALVIDAYDDLRGFLNAQLTLVEAVPNGSRIFTLEYDDSLLVDSGIPILSSDIFGFFCVGLREEWILDKARRSQPIIPGSDI